MAGKDNCNYIFYADESGDHSLSSVDQAYPLFVLSICGFKKSVYCDRIVPRFQKLKFKYFGHDTVVLHEREIRKQLGEFKILNNSIVRRDFLEEITDLTANCRFKIFSSIIDKQKLAGDLFPENPYVIALKNCLEISFRYLSSRKHQGESVYFVFEKRGRKEDAELELEFLRIVSGENTHRTEFQGFRLIFADKKSNSTGMQIADLTARPIGINYLRPNQTNRAYSAISSKIMWPGRKNNR